MQLNNTTTGQIAKINKWSLANCRVQVFENGILLNEAKASQTLNYQLNINLDTPCRPDLGTIENELIYLIYSQVLERYPEFNGFEISEETANWVFPLRPIRISLDRQLALEAIYNDNALGQLFNGLRIQLKEYIISNENTLTIYLEELFEQHRAILEQFPDNILIQER